MAIGASEAETSRTDFLRNQARRGLRGVKLVISFTHRRRGKLQPIKSKILNLIDDAYQVGLPRESCAPSEKIRLFSDQVRHEA